MTVSLSENWMFCFGQQPIVLSLEQERIIPFWKDIWCDYNKGYYLTIACQKILWLNSRNFEHFHLFDFNIWGAFSKDTKDATAVSSKLHKVFCSQGYLITRNSNKKKKDCYLKKRPEIRFSRLQKIKKVTTIYDRRGDVKHFSSRCCSRKRTPPPFMDTSFTNGMSDKYILIDQLY